MERLIIENRTELPMEKILPYVETVVTMGKISGNMNEQYCYHTTFDSGIAVSAYRNKKSDRLVVGTYNNAMNGDQNSAG